ncbi:ERI1 exoribonuclease 3 [Caerostris extrusa]|uniref:ERI1 exoribonuclease 3 n=1 Tax=Caerostris extrusa TaxID=172846 RepID=A0AAV4M4B5_CAEEX|nr:ERI1 exoribonuclease 3 [Caerostris extrusa]
MCKTLCYRNKFTGPRVKSDRFSERIPKEVYKRMPKHHKIPLFETEPVKLPPKLQVIPKQKFDYFLVLDIEATCDCPVNIHPQEIIEFPVLKVNGKSFKTEAVFHSYVKPVIYPNLSDFCSGLTGIIQEMVDDQPEFKIVFKNFLSWLEMEEILKPGVNFAFVTCSDPDLEYFFPMQCKVSDIEVPDFMKQWINVKRSFCDNSPYVWPANLDAMMKYCELKSEGELHSGIDDAKNIAKVIKDLAERGYIFDFNGSKE